MDKFDWVDEASRESFPASDAPAWPDSASPKQAADRGVVDDPEGHRLVFEAGSHTAQLVYREVGSRLVLLSTDVPPELGGKGVGSRLVEAAVARAAEKGLTLVPWCPFARRWLTEHPAAIAELTVDWTPPAAG